MKTEQFEGMMTKREQIAAMAMQGFITGLATAEDDGSIAVDYLTKASVACADALIKKLRE